MTGIGTLGTLALPVVQPRVILLMNPRPLHKPCPFTSDYRAVPDNSRFLAILFRINEGGPGGKPLLAKSGTVEGPLEVVVT